MIRVAVVEDSPQDAAQLIQFIERYEAESGNRIRTTLFSDGDEICAAYHSNYDIVLMDVQMQFMDGMTAAKVIRASDPEVVIIFITNMAQYAIQGYAVDALDYVLKPVTYFAFSQRLDRAIARMRRRSTRYLTIAVRGGTQKLDIASIYYIESQSHTLIFHTRGGDYATSGTIGEQEKQLAEYGFSRCNKSYLVNLAHVDSIRGSSAYVGGAPLLISRGRKNAFLEELTNYVSATAK